MLHVPPTSAVPAFWSATAGTNRAAALSLTTVNITIADSQHRQRAAWAYAAWGYAGSIAPDDLLLEATDGDRLVGLVRIAHEHGSLVLRGMQVASDSRGRGVASRLLAAATAQLGGAECYCMPYLHLRDFYASAGFEDIDPAYAPRFLAERLKQSMRDGLEVCLMYRPPEGAPGVQREGA
jgi:GNAT superfamily N-acetyltransferase